MILTGPEIRRLVGIGKWNQEKADRNPGNKLAISGMDAIHIDPYDPELVGPNSVDLRLGDKLLVYEDVIDGRRDPHGWPMALDMKKPNPTSEIEIYEDGLILRPGILYLGRTIECIGSNKFVPIVEGRSSVGRLGIHVHVTAGFCDLGFKGTITLEIHVIHPVRIYPNIPICQAYFLEPKGAIELYKGRYMNQEEPTASRFSLSKEEFRGE